MFSEPYFPVASIRSFTDVVSARIIGKRIASSEVPFLLSGADRALQAVRLLAVELALTYSYHLYRFRLQRRGESREQVGCFF